MVFSYFCRYRNVRRNRKLVKRDSSGACRWLAHGAQEGLLRGVQLAVTEFAVHETVARGQFGQDARQCRVVAVIPGGEQVMREMQVQAAEPVAEPAQRTRLRRPVAGRIKGVLIPVVRQGAVRARLE